MKQNKIIVGVRLRPTTKEKLEKIAEMNEMSISEYIRNLIEKNI